MISESSFWKDDLLKQAEFIEGKMRQKRYTIASWSRLEQTILLGSYSVRKLIESKKISDQIASMDISVHCYKSKGGNINDLNWYDLEKHYNLSEVNGSRLKLRNFVSQLIHSFVFVPIWDKSEKYIQSIAFNSDKTKENALYIVHLSDIVDIFRIIGSDYPKEASWTRSKDGEYDLKLS